METSYWKVSPLFRILAKRYAEGVDFLPFLNKTYIDIEWFPHFDELMLSLEKILADEYFVCPVLFQSHQLRRGGDQVYLYQFTENRPRKGTPSWMGAVHGDEIEYIFGRPLDPRFEADYSWYQTRIATRMMSFVANMAAKNGWWTLLYTKPYCICTMNVYHDSTISCENLEIQKFKKMIS